MSKKHKVIILGTGKIGSAIAKMLHHSGRYEVCVSDRDESALKRLEKQIPVQTKVIDLNAVSNLEDEIKGWESVISACSFDINPKIAHAAASAGMSYFDLTEDVETTKSIRDIATKAEDGQIFMPQCGLAPGFIGILGHALSQGFDSLNKVKMRVGALPRFPSNQLMYNLTWSTDGLINEYCNPCEAIKNGERIEVQALEGLERFSLDGKEYEAFNTSGGLGTLCETLEGKVNHMDYKTVRYEGHRYLMDFLVNGLRLGQQGRREILKDILENSLPITKQDVVLVFVTVSGMRDGQLEQVSDARKIYHAELHGEHWSSIQITTAAGMCAAVDLHYANKLPNKGFVRQEQVNLNDFLATEFGAHYNVK